MYIFIWMCVQRYMLAASDGDIWLNSSVQLLSATVVVLEI